MAKHDPVQTHVAAIWREGSDGPLRIPRDVPEEAAIGLSYDSRPFVVLMATPGDLEDLAVGFTVTERIGAAADVERVSLEDTADGTVVDVLLSSRASKALDDARTRSMEARSSCGLCGVETLRTAVRPLAPLGDGVAVTRAAIQAARAALEGVDGLGARTRATHAAAWADADGNLLLVREDVGRHNALDKLIGAALRAGLDPAAAFIVVTSRCSFEMVEKTALAGVSLLVAVSAPTSLAIRKAEEANLTLVAIARADGHMVFTGGQRIGD